MLGVKNTSVRFSVPNAKLFDECCAFLSLRECNAVTFSQNDNYSIVAYQLTKDEAAALLKIARQKKRRYVRRKQNVQSKRKSSTAKRTTLPTAA